jgi:post-segregation antitoxin (ccd killing protein)
LHPKQASDLPAIASDSWKIKSILIKRGRKRRIREFRCWRRRLLRLWKLKLMHPSFKKFKKNKLSKIKSLSAQIKKNRIMHWQTKNRKCNNSKWIKTCNISKQGKISNKCRIKSTEMTTMKNLKKKRRFLGMITITISKMTSCIMIKGKTTQWETQDPTPISRSNRMEEVQITPAQ